MDSATNVLNYYEVKLLQKLPLESDIVLAKLNKMNLLPRDTRPTIRAKRTREKKVSYFIHHVIKPGAVIFLPLLVSVMEQWDDLAVRKLAKKMNKKLNSGLLYYVAHAWHTSGTRMYNRNLCTAASWKQGL